MALNPLPVPPAPTETECSSVARRTQHDRLRIDTKRAMEFVDITALVADCVLCSGITDGMVNVQTSHTTTAIVVNEHEPLLLEDMMKLLKRWAPRGDYGHDDFDNRTVNLAPDERANGHSHARALLLGTSETLNVAGGRIRLGRWQRIFFVELDGPRTREVSVTSFGV
jgi:secondary thiamine-phosphate synthase enzyme